MQSRLKKLAKIERVEPPRRRKTVMLEFVAARRSGEDVVNLKNVHKGYGNRSIYEGLDFMIRRRERWCVMGVNGAGKSTLLKLIAGSTEPDNGTVAIGGSVGFSGDDVEKKCRVLSGGERARLVMAKMLYDPPNFLVLDEPTNHLVMATKEMLINALSEFEGTMLFVSHDRHFLAALSNRVLELTAEGIHQFGGGYTEYVARTGQEAPGLRN